MFHHLKERQVSRWDAVKVNSWFAPWVVEMRQLLASLFVWNDRHIDVILFAVLTTVESSAEQSHAHDTEDEPEDQTDKQNVEDGWYRLHECVHYHLPQSPLTAA